LVSLGEVFSDLLGHTRFCFLIICNQSKQIELPKHSWLLDDVIPFENGFYNYDTRMPVGDRCIIIWTNFFNQLGCLELDQISNCSLKEIYRRSLEG
jgi:hypothetical protein